MELEVFDSISETASPESERLSLTRSNTNGALAHEIVARKGEKIVFQACLEWRPKEA